MKNKRAEYEIEYTDATGIRLEEFVSAETLKHYEKSADNHEIQIDLISRKLPDGTYGIVYDREVEEETMRELCRGGFYY